MFALKPSKSGKWFTNSSSRWRMSRVLESSRNPNQ